MHGSAERRFAVHHGQGNGGWLLLAAAAWKHPGCGEAVLLEALLPGFMAPAQELVKMHHAGGIGVAEAHRAFELEPVVWGGHDRSGRAREKAMAVSSVSSVSSWCCKRLRRSGLALSCFRAVEKFWESITVEEGWRR